jgi:hypothetical protein
MKGGGFGAIAPLIPILFHGVSDHPHAPVALLTGKEPPAHVKFDGWGAVEGGAGGAGSGRLL